MSAETAVTARTKPPARRVAMHVLLITLAVGMLYPLLWMLVSSLRENENIFTSAGLALTDATLANYVRGWDAQQNSFAIYFRNSFIVTGSVIMGNLIACSLTAFAFARMRFRLKALFMGIMLVTIMLPEHVTIVPQYILFSELGWLNTFLPLTVPKFFATDPFFIFLMVQFMRGIPRDIDEAASIDGCGPFQIYWRIMLPLVVPALATTAIFSFIWTWNDFFRPLVFLTDNDLFTVPLAIRLFVDLGGTDWGALFAMSVLSLVPIFIFFVFGQRYLIRGIATTGLK
ncbi:carbohydrate ABC transporter permease [Ruania halotolerans]|uniref:carbohydrate ABC transporter permease n=1 Tax=Ruania halotolerans TaxID=2897773 RepID=UPI001E5BBE20|nr:carbohydrate ABC transporter permease [Ruania halotolerans]UFU07998.1 carbohydrate ABC transporter permease [Ruania halotolerans]